MKTVGVVLAISAAVVGLTSSASASSSKCLSIADPMTRLACYDRAANAAAPSGNAPSNKTPLSKALAVNPLEGAAANTLPTKPIVKALSPANPGPRFWLEAEGGIYGFSKNQPIIAATAPPASTGPTFIPTSPGFIGLLSISTVTNPLTTGSPADIGGGGSYRMGYWLDPGRTMAVEGSLFYMQGSSRFSAAPTSLTTSTFVNTTPDVFVGLFNDTTTTTMNGIISDQLYGGDANFRVTIPQFAGLSNFDVMFGMRYTALEEKVTADITSLFSRTYQPSLGLPTGDSFSNSSSGPGTFKIRNDFIGPQVGFNAEQHWGPYWVANENKLAVGATIEHVSVFGSSLVSTTPTTTVALAGIPLTVNSGGTPTTGIAGSPPSFGVFAQGDRSKVAFAVVPSGNIKFGYDIIPNMLSLTLAYNYLYMSNVGRIGDQAASPSDIRQSGFFAQGITLGAKAAF